MASLFWSLVYAVIFFVSQVFAGLLILAVTLTNMAANAAAEGKLNPNDPSAIHQFVYEQLIPTTITVIPWMLLVSCLATLAAVAIIAKLRDLDLRKFASLNPTKPAVVIFALFFGIGFSLAFNSLVNMPGLEVLQDYETSLAQSMLFGSILTAIIGSTIVPIAEEIVFRGFMLNELRRGWGLLFSMLFSSIIFGILHGTAAWAVFAAVLGLLLAWLALRTRSIYPAIAAHMGINGASFVFVWTEPEGLSLFILMLAVGLLIFVVSSVFIITRTRPLSELEPAPEPLPKRRNTHEC